MNILRALKKPSNLLTFSGLLSVLVYSVGALFLDVSWGPLWTTVLILYGYVLADILDGIVARKLKIDDNFGRMFDVMTDRMKDAMLSYAVIHFHPSLGWHFSLLPPTSSRAWGSGGSA